MAKIETCRACKNPDLSEVVSLGSTPLANALLTYEQLTQPEAAYPLDLVFCPDCTLLQITETIPPEQLFRDYAYFSSYADTTVRNAEQLVKRLIKERSLSEHSLAMEVASNDGYLLTHYQNAGIPVLGIEPAENIARVAQGKGIRTLSEFFNLELARKLVATNMQADVVHANNVLAHVADLEGVVNGLQLVLKDNGVAVIEVPYVRDMISNIEFDTIYHEHLCYFSVTALNKLFSHHALKLLDVETIPIHGGSIRLFIGKNGAQSQRVTLLLDEERNLGMNQLEYYSAFGSKILELKNKLTGLLKDLKKSGSRIAAYGASAKGSTLLNCFNIGSNLLDFVVDRSPFKQGLYTPGTHLPIYSPGKLLEAKPDYVLLLTWNFAKEILEQQANYIREGGCFIIPLPEPRILSPVEVA